MEFSNELLKGARFGDVGAVSGFVGDKSPFVKAVGSDLLRNQGNM